MATVEARIAPFINEIFYVTGEFGTVRPTHTHVGIDLATTVPKNLYSMLDGIVIYKDYNSIRGNYIIVKGNNGLAFNYQHMQNPSPKNVSDRVSIGEFLGIEGTTGEITGLHLHLEMQDLSNRNWIFDTDITHFLNPADFMEIPNVTGTEVYYNGSPIPPKPSIKNRKNFPWVLYAQKLRKRRIIN